MPRARLVVWDLDGVLADVRHRLHHVERYPKEWDAFFTAAPSDPVLEAGRLLLGRHVEEGLAVAYLSGRPERCRADTTDWLTRHHLPKGEVYLRPDRDHRPARVVKLQHLLRLAERYDIVEVVDDDPDVVAELVAAGFPVLHATWMHEEGSVGVESQVLWDAQEREGRT
jgi:phosphoglycolate phosphatase-like HAD superfamily hydrolase